jgi:hypothetical protein
MFTGLGFFLDGFFRLDCRGIDAGCTNDSWHSAAHKMNNRFLFVAFAAAIILAFAFRRIPEWRGAWLTSLLAVPAAIVCGVLFSVLGDGASQRAANLTLFAWFVFPRCALDPNGKCTSSADRVTESVSIPAFSGRRRQAGIGGEGGNAAITLACQASATRTRPSPPPAAS